jgi:hypothetical protein
VPKDWLAFVDQYGGFVSQLYTESWDTPEILVFQNGRVIWRDLSRTSIAGDRCDPELWREGTVDRAALAALRATGERNRFFTVQPEPPRPGRGWISDLPATAVGLALGARARKVTVYALGYYSDQPSADLFTRTAAAVANAIWALKPAASHRYDPPAIRVAIISDQGQGGEAVPWPLTDHPALTEGAGARFNYYSGADARAVIAALSRNIRVRIGGKIFQAAWAPTIITPRPPDPVPPPRALRRGKADAAHEQASEIYGSPRSGRGGDDDDRDRTGRMDGGQDLCRTSQRGY